MRSHLILANLFVVGSLAFAPTPIRWGGFASKRFILMPASRSLPVMAAEWPQKLTIGDHPHEMSAGEIPQFTAKPDDTIVWESRDLCIEASGIERGNMVRLSRCNGGPMQKWNWFPWGPMQLKGTNQCVDVLVDTAGALNGSPVVLRECENTASGSWEFEAPEKQHVDIRTPWHASSLFNLAVLSLSGLSIALLVFIFDKLRNRGTRARSQPLFSGAQMAAVMAVQPEPITGGDASAMRATLPKMVAGENISHCKQQSRLQQSRCSVRMEFYEGGLSWLNIFNPKWWDDPGVSPQAALAVKSMCFPDWLLTCSIGAAEARAVGGSGSLAKNEESTTTAGVDFLVRFEIDEGVYPPAGTARLLKPSRFIDGTEGSWRVADQDIFGVPTGLALQFDCTGLTASGEELVPAGPLNFSSKMDWDFALNSLTLPDGLISVKEEMPGTLGILAQTKGVGKFKFLAKPPTQPEPSAAPQPDK